MRVIKANLYLEKYEVHRRVIKLLEKYRSCTGFNLSQSIIQLILRNEEYIYSLCKDNKEDSQKEADINMSDFIREYEESDRIDIFKDRRKDG